MTDASGARPGSIRTDDGEVLEVVWDRAVTASAIAVITHPHPLMGGDMHNPVPAGVARGLAAAGVSALRANFRGTGASTGVHDEGRGEQRDVHAMIDAAAVHEPGLLIIGVGYSFGADVLLAVDDDRLRAVVAVAPPLRSIEPTTLAAARGRQPTLVLAPEHDQFNPVDAAAATASEWPLTTVESIAGTDHFLAGRVDFVVDRIVRLGRELLVS